MEHIPDEILKQFDAVLEQKAVLSSMRDDYRKWLRYYLDFRSKYPPPASKSEQVRLFINKLRSKGQSPENQKQAAHALSLFFESQRSKNTMTYPVREELRPPFSIDTYIDRSPSSATTC